MLGLAPPLSAVAPAVLVQKLVGQGSACAAPQQDGQQGACRQQGGAEPGAGIQQVSAPVLAPAGPTFTCWVWISSPGYCCVTWFHREADKSDLGTGHPHLEHSEDSCLSGHPARLPVAGADLWCAQDMCTSTHMRVAGSAFTQLCIRQVRVGCS